MLIYIYKFRYFVDFFLVLSSLATFCDTLIGEEKPFIILFVFLCGLLGGFVSIQQRLPSIETDELKALSKSWVSITIIPINGGIFALVLLLMFAGGIIQGELFPTYKPFKLQGISDVYQWMKQGVPNEGAGVAKLFFWSFVAGFSERFVPQVIRKTIGKADSNKGTLK